MLFVTRTLSHHYVAECWSVWKGSYISRFHFVRTVTVWLETIRAGGMITLLMSVWDQGRGWLLAPCAISWDWRSLGACLLLWILLWKCIWLEYNFLPHAESLCLAVSACSLSFYFGIKLLSFSMHTDFSFHSHSKMTELRISGIKIIEAYFASRPSCI